MRSLLPIALLLAGATACYDDDDCDCDSDPPVFFESENNDDPANADFFGVLFPGYRFFIEGQITNDGSDPFDGFAFTAGEPIHVDFQLFIDDGGDDLDVCLYDPQIDETVACFATDGNPERGGADITLGGLDFQFVVESFHGASTYAMEIVVHPLFAARAAGSADGPAILAESNRAEGRAPAAESGYRMPRAVDAAPGEPEVVIERRIEFDPETGLVLEIVHVRR
jgi:hypothetical protein